MNDQAVIALACQIVRLCDRVLVWKQTAESCQTALDQAKYEAVSARADAVTRAEADRVRIEALSEDLRKEREAYDGLKQALGIQAAKEAGRVLGMADGEGLRGAAERVVKERDALRAEVAALQKRLRASIARGDFAQMEVAALMSQTPKQHPVAVGDWVRKTTDGLMYKTGEARRLVSYEIIKGEIWCNLEDGASWKMSVCEPCDPPTEATHDTPEGISVAESVIRDDRNTDPKLGDTVRLVRVPTQDEYPLIESGWLQSWGAVGDARKVRSIRDNVMNRRVVVLDNGFEWPLSCVEVVRTDPDEIKVGDLVEVYQATAVCTRQDDIGSRGIVEFADECVSLTPVDGFKAAQENHVGLCDVRKVTT